jgi:hypothetical protein
MARRAAGPIIASNIMDLLIPPANKYLQRVVILNNYY